jgi:WD40 repeat protein
VSLTPGTLLGAYEVGALIGAGGMGEVYRARDTRLHRDVALKVLPQTFAADPERLARFKREAQLLASLSHSNVGAIYGLEELASSSALVLELVEGPTLADRIASGPLPLEEALSIATQVADALEAAHELGIVHRDLKPANIKVRPDGTVKVLDFGLAKALDTAPASTTLDNSPTITSPAMTLAGVILGTAAYMSPEQARGHAADRRSDIWAFGVVVFEMLTARRAFKGDDVPDILAAVLRAEPEWSALPPTTPRSIRRLLRRCLEKDRRRRLQHIGDARLELADPDDSEPPAPGVTAAARRRLWPIVVATVSGATVVAFAAWMMRPAPVERPVTRFTIQVPEMARVFGTGASVVISPDGRTLVYVVGGTRPGLERRQLHDGTTERVRGTDGGSRPFFSPDGQWLGFFADNKLKKVPVAGGVAVTLADAPRNASGAWGDNGSIVIARPDLRRVASTGGAPEVILEPRDVQILEPEFLPGSKSVLVQTRTPPNPGFIEIVNLETRIHRRLLEGGSPKLAATGDLLFMRQGRLWGAKFDAGRGEIVGTPVQLGDSVNNLEQSTEGPTYATSRDGTFVYMAGEAATSVVWLTRTGASTTALAADSSLRNPRLSPDGGRVLVNGTSAADLWIFDFARGSRLRLTTAGYNRGGAWSPDGGQIAFFSLPQALQPGGVNTQDIFVIPSSGGSPTLVLERPGPQWVDSWSPNGRYLMLDDGPGFSRDLLVLPLGGEPRAFVATRFNERSGVFSPDGGSVAFVSDESGRDDVYVLPFSGGGQKVPISVNGGRQPVWSRDGRELFYREDDAMMVVAVKHSPFQASAPRKLFDMPGALYGLDPYSADYDVAPDGRFISVRREGSADIQVILNWTEELRHALGK